MKTLPASYEIRTLVYADTPLPALRALDAPGIAVCGLVRPGEDIVTRCALWQPHVLALYDPPDQPIDPSGMQRPPRIAARFDCLRADAVSGRFAEAVRAAMLLPCGFLARDGMPRREEQARGVLRELGMPERLRGFSCIARGAALLSALSPPLPPLQCFLYPLLAEETGVTPAAVERRIRCAIESAWLQGSLTAQAQLMGLSVSAERGKPTNSELLCRLAERICELTDGS